MELDFKKFDNEKELEEQRKLFLECFPENTGTAVIENRHYYWKFHSKKGKFQSAEYIACSESEIIGYYAAIPYYYSFQGRVLTAAMVCDVMTGVKARGKGVFTKLGVYSTTEFAKQGFDFSIGYPIRKEVIPGHIKAGWEKCFELPLFGRFIKFNSFLKKKKLGFLAPFVNVLFSLWSTSLRLLFLPRNRKLTTDITTSDKIDNIEGLTEFYKNCEKETQISLIKNLDFLKWRLGAPENLYYIITLHNQNSIVGVLIACEVEKEGIPCMGILDLVLIKDYHKYAHLLINELIKKAKQVDSELLLVMMGKRWFKKYNLSCNSFLKTPYKFCLIIKQLNPDINAEILKNEDNWHLMWIDSDDL
jgi:hypothetical protein